MKTKHTPGPWKTNSFGDAVACDYAIVARCIAYNGVNPEKSIPETAMRANAKLIAAAPDLLEALQGILDIGKRDMSNPKYDGYFNSAKEAIQKATT